MSRVFMSYIFRTLVISIVLFVLPCFARVLPRSQIVKFFVFLANMYAYCIVVAQKYMKLAPQGTAPYNPTYVEYHYQTRGNIHRGRPTALGHFWDTLLPSLYSSAFTTRKNTDPNSQARMQQPRQYGEKILLLIRIRKIYFFVTFRGRKTYF